jgi:hypothetical protein
VTANAGQHQLHGGATALAQGVARRGSARHPERRRPCGSALQSGRRTRVSLVRSTWP